MTGTIRATCQAAALALLLAVATAGPAKAQFGGSGSEQDMMTQFAPMLEMMKAKMGKKRFAMMMQTMGPMMSNMMEGGGGGFGGMLGGAGFGGFGSGFNTASFGTAGGGDFMSVLGGSGMTAMLPQMMSMIDTGSGRSGRRAKKRR